MLQIDELLLLHLSRSAPSLLSPDCQPSNSAGSEQTHFSMFDYFNWLTVERGRKLDDRICLGLTQTEADSIIPVSSSQYLTLVTLNRTPKEHEEVSVQWGEGDPLFCHDLSLPFLSVMLVTVLPGIDAIDSARTETDIESFLLDCAEHLEKLVGETCRQLFHQEDVQNPVCQAVYRIYHCVNSGSFCIAVRSRTPEMSYHVSMNLRAAKFNESSQYGFPPIDCSTFSLAGVYCPIEQGSDAWVPPEDVQTASPSKAALRLSVTNQVRNELFRKHSSSITEAPCGLYGRYDVTLHVPLEEFWKLHPWICAHKLGTKFPEKSSEESGNLMDLLRQALENRGAHCINVRLLLDVAGSEAPADSGNRQRRRQERVRTENHAVTDQLRELELSAETLPCCQMEYQRCLCLVSDLWESYSSLRYQEDSFINGNMLLAQISLLLKIIRNYIQSIADMDAPKAYYDNLVDSMRKAVESISHFQKLMLSINQQSLQAPNYEVQMHTDMEKFAVAYTEFCRRFLTEHLRPESGGTDELKSRQQRIFPIIIVDVVRDSIQATPLFLLPYSIVDGTNLVTSNSCFEQILLSIKMPDISAFGSIYQTLPLICHELFHNFRVQDRNVRNNVLAHFLLHRVAQYVVRRWLSQVGERNRYTAFGELENRLFVDKLTGLLEDAYREQCGKAHETSNIGALMSNILRFLMDNVFIIRKSDEFYRPRETSREIQNTLEQLSRLALDAGDTEKPAWGKSYEELRVRLEKGENPASLKEEINSLAEKITWIILDGCVSQVLEAGLNLRDLAGSSRSVSVIEKNVDFICDEDNVAACLTWSPGEIDRRIQQINLRRTKIMAACRDESDPSREMLFAAKTLDFTVCRFCRALKDTNHLLQLLGSAYLYHQKHQTSQNQLLKNYHAAIGKEVQKYCDSRHENWLLYSAPQMQELLAPLGADLKTDHLFVQELQQVLFSCPEETISLTVKDSTTLYREVFADLGMCTALKLSTFGYLRVLARSGIMEDMEPPFPSMKLERMVLVSRVLLNQNNAENSMEKLLEDVRVYFHRVTAVVEKRADLQWKKFYSQLETVLQHKTRVGGIPAYRYTIETVKNWFGTCTDFQNQYCQMKYLWNLVHLAGYLEQNLTAGDCHPLKNHFMELAELISKRWEAEQNAASDHAVLTQVGQAYNDPERTDLSMCGQKAFKDTLSFVLHNYYLGWNIYGQDFQKSEDTESWTKGLMGGGARP